MHLDIEGLLNSGNVFRGTNITLAVFNFSITFYLGWINVQNYNLLGTLS